MAPRPYSVVILSSVNIHDNITLEITENLKNETKKIIYGVNKCNGTLVMLLFNAGLDVLMKILSFTCRA